MVKKSKAHRKITQVIQSASCMNSIPILVRTAVCPDMQVIAGQGTEMKPSISDEVGSPTLSRTATITMLTNKAAPFMIKSHLNCNLPATLPWYARNFKTGEFHYLHVNSRVLHLIQV